MTGGLLEDSVGKERSIAWAERFRRQAAARATSQYPAGPAVNLPPVYRRGSVVRGQAPRAAKLAKQRRQPRTGVEREAEVAAAIERITSGQPSASRFCRRCSAGLGITSHNEP